MHVRCLNPAQRLSCCGGAGSSISRASIAPALQRRRCSRLLAASHGEQAPTPAPSPVVTATPHASPASAGPSPAASEGSVMTPGAAANDAPSGGLSASSQAAAVSQVHGASNPASNGAITGTSSTRPATFLNSDGSLIGTATGSSTDTNSSSTDSSSSSSSSSVNRALSSLGSLLGSMDSDSPYASGDAMGSTDFLTGTTTSFTASAESASSSSSKPSVAASRRRLQSWVFQKAYVFSRLETVSPPKVWPLVTYGIYYAQIVCYAVYLLMSSTQGPDAAEQLVASFTNDHLLVATDGEVYRFFTCALVHDGPVPLFITLLSLVTLAPELEALLGHSAFASVYLSALLTASFADAALGILPVTQGAYPAVAGMVGALLAHQAKNWDLEIQVENARRLKPGEVNQVARVQVFDFLKLERKVSREGRALLAVASTITIAFQALVEVNASVSGGDTFTSWAGMVTACATGATLAWFTSPRYKVQRASELQVLPDLGPTSPTSSLDSDPSNNPNKAAGPLATTTSSVGSLGSYSSIGSLDEERRSALGSMGLRESDVVLTDETTGWQRAVVVLGYNVALYLVAQAWLWAR